VRTNLQNYIAMFALIGTGVAGCGTVPSDTTHSFIPSAGPSVDVETNFASDEALDSPKMDGRLAAMTPRPKPETAAALLLAEVEPKIVDQAAPVQCVPFARDASGIEIRGDAKNWWKLAEGKYARSRRPKEGSVFVMRGYQSARRGHVAVVRQVLDERTIVVDHANWGNDGRVYLSAPVRDESPKNDWSKVRVWYTPADQWGRRIYRAKGFIHPTTEVASNSTNMGRN
jgi:surface antigen